MALDVYFKADILHMLNAVYVASEAPGALLRETGSDSPRELDAHRAGFAAALVAVGLAFGLEPDGAEAPFPLRSPNLLDRR